MNVTEPGVPPDAHKDTSRFGLLADIHTLQMGQCVQLVSPAIAAAKNALAFSHRCTNMESPSGMAWPGRVAGTGKDFTFLRAVVQVCKAADGQIKSVRVGFDGERLAVLDILDNFGQRSVIRFTGMQVNPALPADAFQFRPPVGADVLRQ